MTLQKVRHMDCLNFLDTVPDLSIDLAVIDPPYNLKVDTWDEFESHDHFLEFTFGWLDALLPKIKQTGSLYVFNTAFNSAFILGYLHEKKMLFQNWITWDKRDGFSVSKKKYVNGQETVLFFTKGKNYTFNCEEIRIPYESTERIKPCSEKRHFEKR